MSAPSTSSSSKTCDLCNVKQSKYCCPRCEILYCSVDCYKSEGHMTCSEEFYRECVNDELTSHYPDDESKLKMMDILKKMKSDLDGFDLEHAIDEEVEDVDSDDNASETFDLEERIKGIDLGDADAIWDVLNEDERNEFEALLNEGDVTSIVPQWEPWWSYSKEARLVEDVNNKEEIEALKKCPEIISVAEFNNLMTVQPSPTIRYNIANVLSSYAVVMRYFNGEVDPVEWTSYLLTVCANLDTNTNFEDLSVAVQSVQQRCLQSELIETDEQSMLVLSKDTFFLLQGPSDKNATYYCKAALSHIYTILESTRNTLKLKKENGSKYPELDDKPTKLPKSENSEIPQKDTSKGTFSKKFPEHRLEHLPKLDSGKLKKCMKKLEFYLSFVECRGLNYE